MKEIIVVIFDALCLVVQVCREGRLIRRNADTHKLTLKSLHYISSFLPAGLLFWQANRPGSLEWKDLDRRAANTSPLPVHPAPVHPRGFTHYRSSSSTAMYMRCSHFNLSQSERTRLSPAPPPPPPLLVLLLLLLRVYLPRREAAWAVDLRRQMHAHKAARAEHTPTHTWETTSDIQKRRTAPTAKHTRTVTLHGACVTHYRFTAVRP